MDIKDKDPKAPILLAEKLKQFNAESRIQVSSFHQNQIIEFRKHSKYPTSASIGESWQFHKKATKWIKHNENRLRELKADDELGQQQILEQQKIFGSKLPYCSLTIFEGWGPLRLVTPDIVKFAHLVGIAVLVWTINSPLVMKKLLDWNVDGIFTDAPGKLLTIVKEYT